MRHFASGEKNPIQILSENRLMPNIAITAIDRRHQPVWLETVTKITQGGSKSTSPLIQWNVKTRNTIAVQLLDNI